MLSVACIILICVTTLITVFQKPDDSLEKVKVADTQVTCCRHKINNYFVSISLSHFLTLLFFLYQLCLTF